MTVIHESEQRSAAAVSGVRRTLRILFLGNAYNPISVECAIALAGTDHELIVASYEPLSKGLVKLVLDAWRTQGFEFLVRKTYTLMRCRLRIFLRSLGLPLRGICSLPEAALAKRLRTMSLVNPNNPDFISALRAAGIDLIVVAAFSRILKKGIIEAPPLGCLNAHPSLLPKYRGPNPIYWVLANNEKSTGVTVHYIDEGVDTGPVLLQRELEIKPRESERSLMRRCARLAAEVLPLAVSQVAQGSAVARVQDETQASYYPNPPRGASSL